MGVYVGGWVGGLVGVSMARLLDVLAGQWVYWWMGVWLRESVDR